MTTSWTAIWVMCAVIVIALAAWLIMVALAARKPYFEHPHMERRRGPVQGGTHAGPGRSVSPRPDEPVVPADAPSGEKATRDIADEHRHG